MQISNDEWNKICDLAELPHNSDADLVFNKLYNRIEKLEIQNDFMKADLDYYKMWVRELKEELEG